MVFERKALRRFKAWRQRGGNHALRVKGARQVGKSFLVGRFAEEAYEHVASFDLVENPAARDAFLNARDAEDLLMRIGMLAPSPLVPGKTVIVIDEVQKAPEIVTFVKYLVTRGDFDYILTGSLLGVELEDIDSFPVGYATEVQMYPMDFEEFCWAHGCSKDIRAVLEGCLENEQPVPDYLHERLTNLFHRYLICGGMPDAIATDVNTGRIDDVRDIQSDIRRQYRRDISQYAPKDRKLVIRDIFDKIPSQLSQQNRRFQLSSIENVKRYRQIEDEFLWLTAAGVAYQVCNAERPAMPLVANQQRRYMKLFSNDVGLLTGAYLKADSIGIMDGRPKANMGGVYENFVAQELCCHGFEPYYFTKAGIGELDLIAERRDGTILAFEVKSGRGYKTHTALDNALAIRDYGIDEAFVLAECNLEREGNVLYLPIYMIGMLANE